MGFFNDAFAAFSPQADGFQFMWIILFMGIAAMAIAIERGIYLFFKAGKIPKGFVNTIITLAKKEQIEEAITKCKNVKNLALSYVLQTGLENAGNGVEKITNSIEEATLSITPDLEKRTNYLAMFGNVATLVGLMGTIYGLILSFKAVGAPGIEPAEKSQMLAKGISAAMFTTLAGLAAAIPCILVHTVYSTKIQKLLDNVEEYGLVLTNLLTERSYKPSKFHISAAQIKEGIGIHVTNKKIQIFTDNQLVKEVVL